MHGHIIGITRKIDCCKHIAESDHAIAIASGNLVPPRRDVGSTDGLVRDIDNHAHFGSRKLTHTSRYQGLT